MFYFIKKIRFDILLLKYKSKTLELVFECIDIAANNNNSDPSFVIKSLINNRIIKRKYSSKQVKQLIEMGDSSRILKRFGARYMYISAFSEILLVEAKIYMMPINIETDFDNLVGGYIDNIEPMQQLVNRKIPT